MYRWMWTHVSISIYIYYLHDWTSAYMHTGIQSYIFNHACLRVHSCIFASWCCRCRWRYCGGLVLVVWLNTLVPPKDLLCCLWVAHCVHACWRWQECPAQAKTTRGVILDTVHPAANGFRTLPRSCQSMCYSSIALWRLLWALCSFSMSLSTRCSRTRALSGRAPAWRERKEASTSILYLCKFYVSVVYKHRYACICTYPNIKHGLVWHET